MPDLHAVADALDNAADWLLVNGRCRDNARGADGSGCVIAAIYCGNVTEHGGIEEVDAAFDAQNYINQRVSGGIVRWNERADDDEVRDTLLLAAKDLRAEASPL